MNEVLGRARRSSEVVERHLAKIDRSAKATATDSAAPRRLPVSAASAKAASASSMSSLRRLATPDS
jgi:hypothetical protein